MRLAFILCHMQERIQGRQILITGNTVSDERIRLVEHMMRSGVRNDEYMLKAYICKRLSIQSARS